MVILDVKSIFENVAAGVFGRWVHAVAKKEVEDACRAVLIHNLLGGGAGGVGLSYGQKQMLADPGVRGSFFSSAHLSTKASRSRKIPSP